MNFMSWILPYQRLKAAILESVKVLKGNNHVLKEGFFCHTFLTKWNYCKLIYFFIKEKEGYDRKIEFLGIYVSKQHKK